MPELEIPTAEEIFDKPYALPGPLPRAWDAETSFAAEIADRECARLLVNCLFDPPITEEEIRSYARRFHITEREAEIQIRRMRDVAN